MSENYEQRVLPNSDLDFQLMLTDSVWGKKEVSAELRERVGKYYAKINENGEQYVDRLSLWGLLGFYTRDMRLANLSAWDGELATCRYHIDLANDLLNVDMVEPFIIALSRAATIMETSQSKGGFLRRMFNTLRQESIHTQQEPPKKTLFGGKKKNEYGGNY